MSTGTKKLKVEVAEAKYRFNGRSLRQAIDAAGMTDMDFATACGYSHRSAISHLTRNKVIRVTSATLRTIAKVLKAKGVDTEGLIEKDAA